MQLNADTLVVVVRLETGLLVDRSNAIARMQNAFLLRLEPESRLKAFRSILDNRAIVGFPDTYAELHRMTHEALNLVLEALGLNIDGELNAKRGWLGCHIGLNPTF